jgi:hypothetical protein
MVLREGLQVFVNVEDEIEKLGNHANRTVRRQADAANEKSDARNNSPITTQKWPGQRAPAIEKIRLAVESV